jgi:hypothetical protein
MQRQRIRTETRSHGDRTEIRHVDAHEHSDNAPVLVGVGVALSVCSPLLRYSVRNRYLRHLRYLHGEHLQ